MREAHGGFASFPSDVFHILRFLHLFSFTHDVRSKLEFRYLYTVKNRAFNCRAASNLADPRTLLSTLLSFLNHFWPSNTRITAILRFLATTRFTYNFYGEDLFILAS
jgi:hypothetical protein